MRTLLLLLAFTATTSGYIFLNFWNHCDTAVDVISIDMDDNVETETIAMGDHFVVNRYNDPVTYTFGKAKQAKIHFIFNPQETAFSLDVRDGLEFSVQIQPTRFMEPNGTAISCTDASDYNKCPDAIHNDKEEKSGEKVLKTVATALEIRMCFDSDYPDEENDYRKEKRSRHFKARNDDDFYDEQQ